MGSYFKFRPDLFNTQFNFEHTSALISEDNSSLSMCGTFRTKGDLAALIWNSEDIIQHPYCKYATSYDYTDCILSFKESHRGLVAPFNDLKIKPALAIKNTEGKTNYVSMGFCSTTTAGSSTLTYTGEAKKLKHSWIKWHSVSAYYKSSKGNIKMFEGKDFTINYTDGILYPAKDTTVPYNSTVVVSYRYSDFNKYVFDFNNLYTTESPYTAKKIDQTQILEVLFPLVPIDYTPNKLIMYGRDIKEYQMNWTDIKVENGFLNKENPDIFSHSYRIAEGYDDEYNKCPRRLAREMKKLGYDSIVNLYIGASHFYEKYGEAGAISEGHKSMILDKDNTLTLAFEKWLGSYLKNLKKEGTDELVCSISMENLQMPYEWKQLMFDGTPGGTGWVPATAFYSPTNTEAKEWIEKVARHCLDILVKNNVKPILQWGEPWWWWQEFVPEDVSTPYPNQPPCFYDQSTKDKFKEEFGYDMPVWDRTQIAVGKRERAVLEWLNIQLQEYSEFMRNIAKSYENGEYTVLYFPPSIIDIERVPNMIQICNTPFEAWNKGQCDFIQIEDYDWVVTENPYHSEIYDFGRQVLNYPEERQHYFSGFVMWPEHGWKEWPLIEQAAKMAKTRGIKEVFIWAGTQVRRDGFMIDNKMVSSATNWSKLNFANDF